jgi:hypothetical protein
MTLKQAIKDPSWLLARMSNQKVEGNDGPGFRHVRCPEMLWEELVRLVEGLKVEEGREPLREGDEVWVKGVIERRHDTGDIEGYLVMLHDEDEHQWFVRDALAAQHLKREQESTDRAAKEGEGRAPEPRYQGLVANVRKWADAAAEEAKHEHDVNCMDREGPDCGHDPYKGRHQSYAYRRVLKELERLEAASHPPQELEGFPVQFETIDGEQQTHAMVIQNLTMLVRRLIHRIHSKYKAPDDVVAKQAWDYLMGEGLQGSVLRVATQPPQELVSLRKRQDPLTGLTLDE